MMLSLKHEIFFLSFQFVFSILTLHHSNSLLYSLCVILLSLLPLSLKNEKGMAANSTSLKKFCSGQLHHIQYTFLPPVQQVYSIHNYLL